MMRICNLKRIGEGLSRDREASLTEFALLCKQTSFWEYNQVDLFRSDAPLPVVEREYNLLKTHERRRISDENYLKFVLIQRRMDEFTIWMNEEIDLIRLYGEFHPNFVSLLQCACDQLLIVHSKPRFGLAEEIEKGVELNELAEIIRKGQDDFVFVVLYKMVSEVSAQQITTSPEST